MVKSKNRYKMTQNHMIYGSVTIVFVFSILSILLVAKTNAVSNTQTTTIGDKTTVTSTKSTGPRSSLRVTA